MLYWALVFFIISIVAAVFGFAGIATVPKLKTSLLPRDSVSYVKVEGSSLGLLLSYSSQRLT